MRSAGAVASGAHYEILSKGRKEKEDGEREERFFLLW
jgi:hypothetical protein